MAGVSAPQEGGGKAECPPGKDNFPKHIDIGEF
jgi:hypothetical protein